MRTERDTPGSQGASAPAGGQDDGAPAERQGPRVPPGGHAGVPLEEPRRGAPGLREARDLSAEEIRSLLERNNWGVLATSADDQPYAVPVIYGYDGELFYVANTPGRKVRNLESNPFACLTIAEVEEGGTRWRSVVVLGRVEWIEEVTGRLHAFNVLRKQHGDRPRRGIRDAARLARARVLRIVPAEITGRAKD